MYGAFTIWIIVDPRDTERFEDLLGRKGDESCSQFVKHRNIYVPLDMMKQEKIRYKVLRQPPGTILVIFPGLYHQGFNSGANVAKIMTYDITRISEYNGPECADDRPCNSSCHVDHEHDSNIGDDSGMAISPKGSGTAISTEGSETVISSKGSGRKRAPVQYKEAKSSPVFKKSKTPQVSPLALNFGDPFLMAYTLQHALRSMDLRSSLQKGVPADNDLPELWRVASVDSTFSVRLRYAHERYSRRFGEVYFSEEVGKDKVKMMGKLGILPNDTTTYKSAFRVYNRTAVWTRLCDIFKKEMGKDSCVALCAIKESTCKSLSRTIESASNGQ